MDVTDVKAIGNVVINNNGELCVSLPRYNKVILADGMMIQINNVVFVAKR